MSGGFLSSAMRIEFRRAPTANPRRSHPRLSFLSCRSSPPRLRTAAKLIRLTCPFALLPLSFAAATRRSWEAASQLAQIARGHRGVAAVALLKRITRTTVERAQKTIHFNAAPRRRVVSNENNLGEISSGKNEFGAGSVQCNPGGQNAEDRHDCNHACYEPHESLLSLIGRLALPPHDSSADTTPRSPAATRLSRCR